MQLLYGACLLTPEERNPLHLRPLFCTINASLIQQEYSNSIQFPSTH